MTTTRRSPYPPIFPLSRSFAQFAQFAQFARSLVRSFSHRGDDVGDAMTKAKAVAVAVAVTVAAALVVRQRRRRLRACVGRDLPSWWG
jgi:hypothetical protein